MSEIGKRIDAIVRSDLAPLLKKLGFKKQGKNFHREFEDRTEVINIQNSQWNSGDEGAFFVNLGVYFPQVEEIGGVFPLGIRVTGRPKEYQCTVRTRMDRTGVGSGRRWEVGDCEPDQEIADTLAAKVQDHGLPWLEKMSDLNNVIEELNCRAIDAKTAVIALHLGDREKAKELLDKFIEERGEPNWVTGWGRAHGLLSRPGGEKD